MGKLNTKNLDWSVPLTIDKEELEMKEVQKWRNRYIRDSPVTILPFIRNTYDGYPEQFTIL